MDFQTLLIIVVIGILLVYLLKRGQSSAINPNSQSQGSERPRHDDPNVEGQGSFGRDRDNQNSTERRSSSGATVPSSRNDDPDVQGQGSFGRDRSGQSSSENYRSQSSEDRAEQRRDDSNDSRGERSDLDRASQISPDRLRGNRNRDEPEPRSRNDDPDVQGQGSFGRDKD